MHLISGRVIKGALITNVIKNAFCSEFRLIRTRHVETHRNAKTNCKRNVCDAAEGLFASVRVKRIKSHCLRNTQNADLLHSVAGLIGGSGPGALIHQRGLI